MLLVVNFVLPMLLGDLEIGFDIPFLGHVTLFDPSSMFGAYSFFAGGLMVLALIYFMWQERKRK